MTDLAAGADFERRARQRLTFDLPAGAIEMSDLGDHSLDRSSRPTLPLRPAAVLVPVVCHPTGATVILTQRPQGMRDHSGQIAFPGGKIDPADASPCAAALRETAEEIGLMADRIVPLGYLDPYVTGTGFSVVPTVARVLPPFRLALDPREVADAFEVPLAFLMDPANHQQHVRDVGARRRRFYAMPFEDRFIWGATAGILRNLYERLYGGPPNDRFGDFEEVTPE